MRRISLIMLIPFVAEPHGEELSATPSPEDQAVNYRVVRATKSRVDLENTLLAKAGYPATPRVITHQLIHPFVHGREEHLHSGNMLQDRFANAADTTNKARGALMVSRGLFDSIFGTSHDSNHAEIQPERLAVCTNKNCRKTRSFDTLSMLRALASTHTGIRDMSSESGEGATAAKLQDNFAVSCVQISGCLENCGMGPNVVNTATRQVFRGVSDARTAATLLEGSLGLDIPDVAVKAYSKLVDAKQAAYDWRTFPKKHADKKDEALSLLTVGLNHAGTLHVKGAHLLSLLFKARADLHEELGDSKSAVEDRKCAEYVMQLRYPVAECVEACLIAEREIGTHGCNPLNLGSSPCEAFCGYALAY